VTTVLLIRHATTAHVGRILTGRSGGVSLADIGRAEAAALARRLAPARLDAIRTSPRERAAETAAAIAADRSLVPEAVGDLDEIDFGAFTGKSFAELEGDPDWRRWNEARDVARAPGGETMAEAQGRIVRQLEAVREAFAGGTVALVSHADMIKAAVAHVLDLSLSAIHRFEIDPASVTRVLVERWGSRLLSLNGRE
jgi:broad specificity phosphatase PhoE